MTYRFIRKYFSIVFVVATLLTAMHHHNDLKPHSECKICTIQSNIVNADTPVETLYLSELTINSQAIIIKPDIRDNTQLIKSLQARAPPFFS